MTKPDRLTIRGLSADDQAWLAAESDRLGCDPENLVRMMIRQRIGPGTIVQQAEVYQEPAPRLRTIYPELARDPDPDEPDGTPLPEPAADPTDEGSLDDLMAAGPSILDDAVRTTQRAPVAVPAFDPFDRFGGRGLRYQRPAQRRQAVARPNMGAFSAGSMTRPVGVNPDVAGGNSSGDGVGNVMRDNMRHFGLVGTQGR